MNVDSYLASFPTAVQDLLNAMREQILTLVPDAEEKIAYGMIGYKAYGKPLVYISGNKNHLGLYALPEAHALFQEPLKAYKQGKGSVQFPYDQEIPYPIVQQMVLFNLEKNRAAASLKKSKKKENDAI